ncbi:MAG: hypothetical protein ACRDGS_01310, partial [Chloroflexota bacterium]
MARRFPRGLQIFILLVALVISPVLPIRRSVDAAQGARREASPTWAPPTVNVPLKPQATKPAKLLSVIMEQLTPIPMATNGLKRSGAGWTVAPSGGKLVVRLRSALPLASLGASFALDQSASVSMWENSGEAWAPMSLAEPVERDGPHTLVVDPVTLPSGTRMVMLRFQFSRMRRPAVLSRLRVYGLPAVPAQHASRPATLLVSRTTLGPAAPSLAEGTATILAAAAQPSVPVSRG